MNVFIMDFEFINHGTVPRPCPKCLAILHNETQIASVFSPTKSALASGRRAVPGDVTVCSQCGEILVVVQDPTSATGAVKLALPTASDLRHYRQNTRMWRALQAMSHEIKSFAKWSPSAKDRSKPQ